MPLERCEKTVQEGRPDAVLSFDEPYELPSEVLGMDVVGSIQGMGSWRVQSLPKKVVIESGEAETPLTRCCGVYSGNGHRGGSGVCR